MRQLIYSLSCGDSSQSYLLYFLITILINLLSLKTQQCIFYYGFVIQNQGI